MSDGPVALGTIVVAGGFALSFVFGGVAARTNFCTMGALSDIVNMGHWGRMRMWLLAIAVAVAGTSALAYAGLVDLAAAVARRPVIPWLSLLMGGAIFGVGMTLAGGCANKNLVRLGGGSLRSLVVLTFMAIAAYMTLKGLFAQWRVSYFDPFRIDLGAWGWPDQGLPTAVARIATLPDRLALPLVAAVVALGAAAFALSDRRFRANGAQILGAVVLGLLVTAGWYLTGHLGHGENPETLETVYFATNTRTLESVSFVAPLAFSLEMLMLWTDASLHATFGIASVLGIVAGSAVYALLSRTFRWEGFASLSDLRQQLLGAMMMGFGGVTALGCTIGQGLSGLSTLAIGSFIAVAGIVVGGVGTLRWLLWRAEHEA